jgi:hypothetical protein
MKSAMQIAAKSVHRPIGIRKGKLCFPGSAIF